MRRILIVGLLNISLNVWAGEWKLMTVDTTLRNVYGTAIAVDSLGNPHVAYYRDWGPFIYARWNPADSAWVYEFVSDSVGASGYWPFMKLDSKGFPHISYSSGYLWKDANGWHRLTPPGRGPLALDKNDNPHIVYQCSDSFICHTYHDSSGSHGERTKCRATSCWAMDLGIAIDKENKVHIAHGYLLVPVDTGGGDTIWVWHMGVGYGKLTDSGWIGEIVDTGDTFYDIGMGVSLAVNFLGYPCISYVAADYNQTGDHHLRYAEKTDTGWCVEIVDTSRGWDGLQVAGGGNALYLDKDDNPHIVFEQDTLLKYSWRYEGKWYTEAVDSEFSAEGVPYIASYCGLVIDKDGYSHISYTGDRTASGGRTKYAKGKPDTLAVEVLPKEKFAEVAIDVYPSIGGREIKIVYSLSRNTDVNITIYNIAGMKTKELVNEKMLAGQHTIYWKGKEIRSGIYFCVLRVRDKGVVRKFIIIR